MSEQPKKLMLIDGNSITYRAFFALPPLSNAEGQFTNAVFGFTQMLLKMLNDEQPTHIAVAFDAGKKTFRHAVYAEYKGTRDKTPSELSEQFPLVRELLHSFGIPFLELQNYEADDIIGTLSRLADEQGLQTLVVSGDKDLLQLVSDNVHAILTRKGITEVEHYDPQAITERYGLAPLQIIDLKGLMGDSSDNIPGVPGVGEKTALKLLQVYPSVEEVLAHIDEVSGAKLKERLTENRDQAILSKQLATIDREVPLDCTVDDLRFEGYDPAEVRKIFMKLGFKSLLDKISGEIDSSTSTANATDEVPDYEVPVERVVSKDALQKMWDVLDHVVGVMPVRDAEDYHAANLLGFALGGKQHAYFVSFEGELETGDMRPLWEDDYEKVVFDLKELVYLLDAHGHTLTPNESWFDVMVASYLLNPSDGELTLSDIVERELHRRIPDRAYKDTTRCNSLAVIATLLPELRHHLANALSVQELDDLYQNVEMPLEAVLAKMESLGFNVNEEQLKAFGSELLVHLERLTAEIHGLAGVEFNINSPKQLGEVLFEKLGLPAMKKTKTGYSTSADVLDKLAPYHDVVVKILEFRQLGKLQSTYIEGLLKVIRPETKRVHTRFRQAVTATGRLSSIEPNLQNIPIRMEEGRRLRRAFEPTYDDWVLLASDYSQIELRILAHLSGDEALIEAFREGVDVHTRTAASVFGVPIEEVTSLMRRQAKAVNFGIVYGISDYGLSQNLNISRNQAAKFIEDYFVKFPGVQKYMTDIVEVARKQGYVTTLLNRRRYLPDIHSRNFNLRSFAERTAMNTPIQGTAADIIKVAMVRIDNALRQSDMKARMLLQVHDELIFECPAAEADDLHALVEENMENALTLNVPLCVDIHVGQTWYDAK